MVGPTNVTWFHSPRDVQEFARYVTCAPQKFGHVGQNKSWWHRSTYLHVLCFQLKVMLIAYACKLASKYAQRTGVICFTAVQRVSSRKNEDLKHTRMLKESLLLLGKQATLACPRFTAAGFFMLDYTWVFTVINLIATYLIAISQF